MSLSMSKDRARFNRRILGDGKTESQKDYCQFNGYPIIVFSEQMANLVINEVKGFEGEECARISWKHWVGWETLVNVDKPQPTFENIAERSLEVCLQEAIELAYVGVGGLCIFKIIVFLLSRFFL